MKLCAPSDHPRNELSRCSHGAGWRAFRVAGMLLWMGTALPAQIVTNGSFELGNFVADGNGAMSLSAGSTAITGWTTFNSQLAWISSTNAFNDVAPSHGSYFLDLSGYDDAAPYGGVRQSIATVVGQSYVIGFDLGTNPVYGVPINLTAAAGATSQTFSFTTGVSGYGHYELAFTATSASTLISFVGVDPSGNGIGLDNVTVAAVPEPSAVAVSMGLSAMLVWVRRRARGRQAALPP